MDEVHHATVVHQVRKYGPLLIILRYLELAQQHALTAATLLESLLLLADAAGHYYQQARPRSSRRSSSHFIFVVDAAGQYHQHHPLRRHREASACRNARTMFRPSRFTTTSIDITFCIVRVRQTLLQARPYRYAVRQCIGRLEVRTSRIAIVCKYEFVNHDFEHPLICLKCVHVWKYEVQTPRSVIFRKYEYVNHDCDYI